MTVGQGQLSRQEEGVERVTAETDGADLTDPASSALAHFGNEARLERELLGMSRADFGKEATCGYSLVAKVEQGQRVPPREFAEACDRVFPHANGRFMRLWPLALRHAYPAWFRPYVELEGVATHVRLFNPLLIPGLAQTEEYARAVLRAGRPDNLDEAVTLRMARQHILTGDDPPRLWLVISEYALRRPAMDAAIMHGQLQRLWELAEIPRHVVQILPETAVPFHAGSNAFGLLSFRDGADVAHVDGFPTGYIVADSAPVAEAQRAYDLLRATALSPDESAATIDSIMKDIYT
ncbi:Scr1 family TA system antitoxin-like transcriptional regulator [Streptomyces sp. NPDC059477]|uniref:helix-turn-helix domain-containing protein n=1 Tax=Streptomyces sp. NPDC059477 TaxID=3346847 RepID=UPI0036C396B6